MDAETTSAGAMYRIVEGEARQEVVTALDVSGFFVDEACGSADNVLMVGSSLPPRSGPRHLHEVELQVLDDHQEVMGAYYVGEAQVLSSRPSRVGGGTDAELTFMGFTYPFLHAGEIWRRWRSGPPTEIGQWKQVPTDWHSSWLHVVQTAWFHRGRAATRYESSLVCVVDGRGIANTAGFYCALGEAVNGPGGYFGSGLDALADCLSSAVADTRPFELLWRNTAVSEGTLGADWVHAVVALFGEYGIQVRTGASDHDTA